MNQNKWENYLILRLMLKHANYGLYTVPILFFISSFTFFALGHCFIWHLENRNLEIEYQHATKLVQTYSSVPTFGGFCKKQITEIVLH